MVHNKGQRIGYRAQTAKSLKKAGFLALVVLVILGCNGGTPNEITPPVDTRTKTPIPAPSEAPDPTESTPDVIYHNATIITMDSEQPQAQAIAITGDSILALGTDNEILALAGGQTQVVDLESLPIFPGFIDSHNHRITQRYHYGFSSIQEAVEDTLWQGWTGLVDTAVVKGPLEELIAVDAAGELHTRVNVYLVVNDSVTGEFMDNWYQDYQPGQVFSPYLRIAGLKIFIDVNYGLDLLGPIDLETFIQERQEEGWQVAVRVLGIPGNETALDAVKSALDGASNDQFRHRFEHCMSATDDQIARMEALGIIASIEPVYPGVTWHKPETRDAAKTKGLENNFRWRDYWDAGLFMTASTHNARWSHHEEFYGYTHLSPMGVIYRSATQIGFEGAPPEGWMIDNALTPEELLPMLTINGAYATFEEDLKGSLTPGKWADLVVLSGNPLETPAEGIVDIQVRMTMIGGEVAYCAESSEPMCLSTETPDTTGFIEAVGNWKATDHADGSAMTLEITHLGGERFSISWYDEDAITCDPDGNVPEPLPWIAEGSGEATQFTLALEITSWCVDIDKGGTGSYTLEYDPQTDTMVDNFNYQWERE